MTQIWKDGEMLSVTKVQADPSVISQIKNEDRDGYKSVQLAFGKKKDKRVKKPQVGHFKKAGIAPAKVLREFRVDSTEGLNVGDRITVNTFSEGDNISVTGISKGKGFAGVVKRHGFSGSKKTHGNKDQLRMPGSIGSTGPAHVFKGVRMGGRMGGEQVTTKNLEIAGIDSENNTLLIKGAVPGGRNGLVFMVSDGELKVEPAEKQPEKEKEEKTADKVKEENNKSASGESAPVEVKDNKTDSASVKATVDEGK